MTEGRRESARGPTFGSCGTETGVFGPVFNARGWGGKAAGREERRRKTEGTKKKSLGAVPDRRPNNGQNATTAVLFGCRRPEPVVRARTGPIFMHQSRCRADESGQQAGRQAGRQCAPRGSWRWAEGLSHIHPEGEGDGETRARLRFGVGFYYYCLRGESVSCAC